MMVDRSKFKTEYGRRFYDKLAPLSPHEDWLYLMCMIVRNDERRKIVLDLFETEDDWGKIDDFIMDTWGKAESLPV